MNLPEPVQPWEIICDADDTIIITTVRYHPAMWECGRIMTKALGPYSPHPTRIMNRHHEIDVAMVDSHGFHPERFGMSWVRTYREFASALHLPASTSVERRLLTAARTYLHGPHRTYPRVKRTLRELRQLGHLHLVTVGDPDLQRRKVAETGLARYFTTMAFVERHKDEAIAKAAHGSSRAVMVGDSKRSDILPAIKLGIVPVLIDRHTWDYAEVPLPEGSYYTIKHFEELPALLHRLDHPEHS